MFGLFKKKPKTAADYLNSPDNYQANEQHWQLLLSSLWVEASNIGNGTNSLKHDVLGLSVQTLDDKTHNAVKDNYSYSSVEALDAAIFEYAGRIYPTTHSHLLLTSYTQSEEEFKQTIENYNTEHFSYANIKHIRAFKNRFRHLNHRLHMIAYLMYQVRLAVYLQELDEAGGWQRLKDLSHFATHALAGCENWHVYFDNSMNGENYDVCGYDGFQKSMAEASKQLLENPQSPLQQMSLHYGIEGKTLSDVAPYTNEAPALTPHEEKAPYNEFLALLNNEDDAGVWAFIENLSDDELRESKFYRCLHVLSPKTIDLVTMQSFLERNKANGYAWLMRANWYLHWAWETRGAGTSSTVGEENYKLVHERLALAIEDGEKALSMLPDEADTYNVILGALGLLGSAEAREKKAEYIEQLKQRFPNHIPSLITVANFIVPKWGGSEEQALSWAREAIDHPNAAPFAPIVLFYVFNEIWSGYYYFSEDESEADTFAKNEALKAELGQYLPHMLENINHNPAWGATQCVFWALLTQNLEAVKAIVHCMEPDYFTRVPLGYLFSEPEMPATRMHWFRYL